MDNWEPTLDLGQDGSLPGLNELRAPAKTVPLNFANVWSYHQIGLLSGARKPRLRYAAYNANRVIRSNGSVSIGDFVNSIIADQADTIVNCSCPGVRYPAQTRPRQVLGNFYYASGRSSGAALGASQWVWGEAADTTSNRDGHADEPRLEIGDKIPMKEGVVGVVLARYTRSGDARNDVHYIVELRPEAEEH